MPTAVLTGCNSGIGYCWAQILIKEGYKVYATDVVAGDKLKSLKAETAELDVTSPDSIAKFKQTIGDEPVDVLVNIAGVMFDPAKDSTATVTLKDMQALFSVNAYGPMLLTQALLPNVLKSSEPRIGVISSRVASMTDNSSGGYVSYRAAKAAVNSFFKSIAVENKDKGVVTVILHPGFTKTNLDTTKKTHALPDAVEPEEAAEKLWAIFKSKGVEDTGKFYHREGFELPW